MEYGAWDLGWADLPEPRKGSWLGDTMYGARVVLRLRARERALEVDVPLERLGAHQPDTARLPLPVANEAHHRVENGRGPLVGQLGRRAMPPALAPIGGALVLPQWR